MVAQFIQLINDVLAENLFEFFFGIFLIGLGLWMFIQRDQLKEKVMNEPVSFTAMIISIGLALLGFLMQPEPLSVGSFSTGTETIIIAISATLILTIIMVIAIIFFLLPKKR